MPVKSERVKELESCFLDVGAIIDTCDQSRVALSDAMDEIRDRIAETYGEDFEVELLESMGYEVEEGDDKDESE